MLEQKFALYGTSSDVVIAEQWQQRLAALNVATELCIVEKLSARFLRLHPELSLLVDHDGLWLAANGMKMQPAWHEELHRLKRATVKNELLARACQMNKTSKIIDATAGLGHDALLLAWLGAELTLLERHPVVFALLESSLAQAKQHAVLQEVVQRIHLVHTDAKQYLQQTEHLDVDMIYLDPMFPSRDANQKSEKKQAQVKKQMQLLHLLLPVDGVMDLGEELLAQAQQKAARVIVKRPRHAQPLANQMPQHQWLGDACRFDAYFQ